MQKTFFSLRDLDIRAESKFLLGNGLLMENAARGMAEKIKQAHASIKTSSGEKKTLQIICGTGDNGGDGLALARMLADEFSLRVVLPHEPKSELCIVQRNRLALLNIPVHKTLSHSCDILVDAFLGTGIKGELSAEAEALIHEMNSIDAYKIACDIPSGLSLPTLNTDAIFNAQTTYSMGALKTTFFSDKAKDFVGAITVIDLGVPRSHYETKTKVFLLEKKDVHLPTRTKQDTHKGSFGHALFWNGEKEGACALACNAALKFGVGLVTICGNKPCTMQSDFMYSKSLPNEYTALSLGSGLGRNSGKQKILEVLSDTRVQKKPMVLDADIFYYPEILSIFSHLAQAVITPHPKEFQVLLKMSHIADISIEAIQKNRFHYLYLFCEKYPNLVVLLKGANTLIGTVEKGLVTIFINPLGSQKLAKAGTGDVLTGLITGLLTQGYSPIKAAIQGSLSHACAAELSASTYGLTASELINNLEKLENC